ncbi:cytochrome P450 [Nocardia australiensis]|uniref:cytochrome P450 n=1 Tax=Nocardia australiensis TaxID=2887191 RepID=UPI001D1338F2|nr:cytochrome P450 [Nocardia australiensis]
MARTPICPFNPPPDLARLREDQPISRVRIWNGNQGWLITRYNDVRAVLADPRFSADPDRSGYLPVTAASQARRQRSKSLISMDNPEHDVMRRMLTRDFMIKRVEALRPRIQQIVDDLIDQMLAAGPPTDLVSAFALPVPSLVICELLGVPYADHEFFQRCSRVLINIHASPETSLTVSGELRTYLSDLVRRKQSEAEDTTVLSRLAKNQVANGELTLDEATDTALLLLIAGHETTANMIALGTLALLEHPKQLAELRDSDDPALVRSTVEEMLRYLTIVHSGRRRVAMEDVEVGGQLIRAGEGIIVAGEAANRDAAAFPDSPNDLDIHRDARHHVAFGYGIHQCLGQPLARVELQVVYNTLYRRIPTLRLAGDLADVRFKDDMIVYGVHELAVTW